jgi:hypothetical protein
MTELTKARRRYAAYLALDLIRAVADKSIRQSELEATAVEIAKLADGEDQ